MPFDVTIRNGIVFIAGSGCITSSDLDQLGDALAKIEATSPKTPDRLTDLSQITRLELDFPKVQMFANRRREAPLKNNVKSAFLAPKIDQFGFARMFGTLNDHPNIEIQIFRELDPALEWLGA